ncbi:phosphotransferase [bacterium]|nr:MAG: phosphotransferase [bacterium]
MDQVLKIISELYSIENLKLLHRVEEGVLSNNYILEADGQKYFLKHHRSNIVHKIGQIHQVEKYFSQQGFPVILALPTKDNKLYFTSEDQYYSLLPFTPGKLVKRESLSGNQIKAMGEFLAKLHLAGKNHDEFKLEALKSVNGENFSQFVTDIQSKLKEKPNLTPVDIMAAEHLELQKQLADKIGYKIFSPQLPSDHLVHGDYHDYNLFFDEFDQITALFDFEKTEMSLRTFELIRALEIVCFHGSFKQNNFANAQVFLQAYHSLYPVVPEELEEAINFSYLGRVFSTWITGDVYLKGNSRPAVYLHETHFNLKYFSSHLDYFKSQLLSYIK